MWAQLIIARVKPGKEEGLDRIIEHLKAGEQPGSGLVRSTTMLDQKDPSKLYMMAVFESEEKARERERDPRREKGLQAVRSVMADTLEGQREFVDLAVVEEHGPGSSASDAERNIDISRHFLDEMANKKNLDIVDEVLAPDFVEHEQLPPGVPAGREGVKALFSMMHTAFPDFHLEVDDAIAQGDTVVLRETWRGTQDGEFFGVPPTGKPVSFEVVDFVRFADGKVVEHWGIADLMSVMQQLGAIPVPGSV